MNTAELKSDLHRLIVETNDINILTNLRQYFLQLQTKDVDWWDELSIENKKAIKKGLDDLKNGNTHTDEEVRESIHKRILNAQVE